MSNKLYIGNCAFTLDESALETFMETHGVQASSTKIIRDRETGRSRGFGFVELAEATTVAEAIEALNGKELDGRALTVNEAREKTQSDGGNRGSQSNRW